MNELDWREVTRELSEPFPNDLIKYRAGATTRDKKKAMALPYVDPRDYERRLDEVAPGEWAVDFEPWGQSRLICRLTIYGVTRASTGEAEEDDRAVAVGTAAEAQAFKRACSKFGLGRHLYDGEAQWVAYDEQKRKLLETPKPTPPRQYASASQTRPSSRNASQAAPNKTVQAAPSNNAPDPDEPLDSKNAAEFHAHLKDKYGQYLTMNEHYPLAEAALGRNVKSFVGITRADARRITAAARAVSIERKKDDNVSIQDVVKAA